MENSNWVISAQNLLLLIGILLWFVPLRSKADFQFKLPVVEYYWLVGYLLLGAVGLWVEAMGWWDGLGFMLLPCIVFILVCVILPSEHLTPWKIRNVSLGEIYRNSFVSFLSHWPVLLLVYWASSLVFPDAQPQESVELLKKGDLEMRSKIAFFAVIVAPLTEVVFFRGILYRTLKGLLNARLAMLVTSFAFAAVHLNLLAFFPLFALSFFLILVYERTGHLAVPILYHAAFNILMLTFIIFGKPEI